MSAEEVGVYGGPWSRGSVVLLMWGIVIPLLWGVVIRLLRRIIVLLCWRAVMVLLSWRTVVVMLSWGAVVVLLSLMIVLLLSWRVVLGGRMSFVAILRLSVSISIVLVGLVVYTRILMVLTIIVSVRRYGISVERGRWYVDSSARGFKASLGCAVLYLTDFADIVHVAILAEHLAGRVLGLDLEAAVSTFVAIAV